MYTRNQRSGLIVLIGFLACAGWLRGYLDDRRPVYRYAGAGAADKELFSAAERLKAEVDSLREVEKAEREARFRARYPRYERREWKGMAKGKTKAHAQTQARSITPFAFDPNTLSLDSLLLLGLTEKEAGALLKYRSYRERTFREPEDFLRVGAIDSVVAHRLIPFINIAPAAAPESVTEKKEIAIVDINQATLEEWQMLPGIGPGRAKRITNFRDKLGGFVTVEQVGTTYGLPDSTFQQCKSRMRVDDFTPSLYLNRMSTKQLARHPYLDRRTATILVRYRENHGPFHDAEALKKVRALTTEKRERLLPYLNFATDEAL